MTVGPCIKQIRYKNLRREEPVRCRDDQPSILRSIDRSDPSDELPLLRAMPDAAAELPGLKKLEPHPERVEGRSDPGQAYVRTIRVGRRSSSF